MENRVLYVIIGILIVGIIVMGIFMIIKNNDSQETQGILDEINMPATRSEPATQAELDSMIRTEMPDGTARYESEDGSKMLQRREE